MGIIIWFQDTFDKARGALDFVVPVLLRLYLVPVFFIAGSNKWDPFSENGTLNPPEGLEDVANWFGNPDWGLGLPAPLLMAIRPGQPNILGQSVLRLELQFVGFVFR